jgi:phosphomannomutase
VPRPVPPARPEWFGSSGIRGSLDRVDVELGMRLGRALGSDGGSIIVASDARRTGPALKEAVIAGILATGADVRDAGMLPTPALAHAVRKAGARSGVMVTASHNPSPDNGYKVWGPTGSALSEEALLAIEARIREAPQRAK